MISADTATPRPAHQRACHQHRQARLPSRERGNPSIGGNCLS
jgi:hypothetical protein